MTVVVVGLDIGGTKASLSVETLTGVPVIDTVASSRGWDAEPVEAGATWVLRLLAQSLPAGFEIAALGVGAQGLDTDEVARDFEAALDRQGIRAHAVNDAALLLPAAGLREGLGVIAGTGSIAVGVDSEGTALFAGGWGWVLGDEAGAAGLVREATKAALLEHDDGGADDGLLAALLAAFAVPDAERLARAVNDVPTMENWGSRAPVVFAAADAGSSLAEVVIERAGIQLAHLVTQLVRRTACGSDVVVAGSVILRQPRLFDAFRRAVLNAHPAFCVHRLGVEPVVGALALARRLAELDPGVSHS